MDGVDTGYIYLEDSRGPNFSTPSSPIYVFNNVSSGVGNNGHIVVGTGTPFIANNTIMGSNASQGDCIGYGVTGDEENETSENNAIEGCGTLAGVASTPFYATGQPNYNLYADSSGGASFLCGANFYALSQFSSWQSCVRADGGGGSSAETHSATESSVDLNSDGSPQRGSPTVGAGTNLTSHCAGYLVPLCREIDGTPRPTTGAWDVGAY